MVLIHLQLPVCFLKEETPHTNYYTLTFMHYRRKPLFYLNFLIQLLTQYCFFRILLGDHSCEWRMRAKVCQSFARMLVGLKKNSKKFFEGAFFKIPKIFFPFLFLRDPMPNDTPA